MSSSPETDGQTIIALAEGIGVTDDIVVSQAGQTYESGRNRFSFGIFNADGSGVNDADVALYAAPGPNGEASGPFPARIESLQTDPAFASKTTAAEPQPVTVAYVSEIKFDRPGEWRLVAVIRQGTEVEGSGATQVRTDLVTLWTTWTTGSPPRPSGSGGSRTRRRLATTDRWASSSASCSPATCAAPEGGGRCGAGARRISYTPARQVFATKRGVGAGG